MKLGFAAKKNKKSKKKKQTQKNIDGGNEAHMRDAEDVPAVASSVPASAKDKQKQKMQQKKALQLRVDSLKKSRYGVDTAIRTCTGVEAPYLQEQSDETASGEHCQAGIRSTYQRLTGGKTKASFHSQLLVPFQRSVTVCTGLSVWAMTCYFVCLQELAAGTAVVPAAAAAAAPEVTLTAAVAQNGEDVMQE
jgi:hypothetical protein